MTPLSPPSRPPSPAPRALATPRAVVLLGPQRFAPTLGGVVEILGIGGKIATVTAGWQEREGDDGELHEHLGGRTVNLRLHERAIAAFAIDPDLAAAYRLRQDRLRALQEVYTVRFEHLMAGVFALIDRIDDDDLVEPEVEDALAGVRALDRHHLERVRELHREFEDAVHPQARDSIRTARGEIARLLEDAEAIAIAGGHVAVLLNRLRLFDMAGLIGTRAVLAWSAGAMALGDRVVLFHDHPPQGPGDAAVLEGGLGIAHGVVLFPHAHRRLALDDVTRVSVLARRFAPDVCLALDDGGSVWSEGRALWNGHRVHRLGVDGSVRPLAESA